MWAEGPYLNAFANLGRSPFSRSITLTARDFHHINANVSVGLSQRSYHNQNVDHRSVKV